MWIGYCVYWVVEVDDDFFVFDVGVDVGFCIGCVVIVCDDFYCYFVGVVVFGVV